MRIVLAHNYYRQPGGEDQVFEAEGNLLESYGHEVYRYSVHNGQIADTDKLELASTTLWNRQSYRTLRDHFRRQRPDIVHVHNTLPLISPAVYYAAKAEGAAVVQTLHNFRLLCPKATFFRDGKVCEDCLHKAFPWPAVQHACYRDSHAASGVVATMLAYHRAKGTYQNEIDAYIALTEFSRQKFIDGGLPASKLHVKGNFLAPDPGRGEGKGGYALFVGRMSEEKGIAVLLEAWSKLGGTLPLKIVGTGPLTEQVVGASKNDPLIKYLGYQPRQRVLELMKDAQLLIFPSLWYEGAPMTLIEAFSVGLPVVASDLGAMPCFVEHHRTGLLYESGNAHELAGQIQWLFSHPERLAQMRREARSEYERFFTSQRNYQHLMSIYVAALATRQA